MAHKEKAVVVGADGGDEIVVSVYQASDEDPDGGVELALLGNQDGKFSYVNLSPEDLDNLIEALEEARDGELG